jgi:AcrR family transcriptional regulator
MGVETHKRADAVRNREAVLEAAIRLLAERPHASMRDVADASGLGRTTVYRHFSTREDLVRALFDRIVEESGERMQAAAAMGGDARTVLRQIASDLVALGERFRFLEHHRDLEDQLKQNPDGGRSEPYAAWFSQAQADGGLRGDVPVGWMIAMLRGMTVAAIDEMLAGRTDALDATRMLGDTFVAAFTSG